MTDKIDNKTSILVKSQVPDFVRADHQLFVEFMEYYYKFLEQDGQLQYVTKNFPRFLDIDEIKMDIDHDAQEGEEHYLEEETDYHAFLQKLYDNFTALIPDSILADKVMLLKHAKEFYRTRGSEKSIRFLMRALYNQDIEFYYPKRDILRASDGKWFIEKSLNVTDFAVNNVANSTAYSMFVGRQIRGATSNSTCSVEAADQYFDNGVLVTELKISGVEQDFENGEEIFTFFDENGEVKRLSCNLFAGQIFTITVTNPGSGYIEGSTVPINSNSGSGALVIISKVTRAYLEGKIKSVDVIYQGAGFRANDSMLFTGGGGRDAAGEVSVVNQDETYHPSSYDIVGSRIIDVANNVIANTLNVSQGESYTNLVNVYINTSNLLITTGTGPATTVNLDFWVSNSNVYFETGDYILCNSEYVLVTSSNTISNTITVSPELSANISAGFDIYKKPNANTTIANSVVYWQYANCGPILSVRINNPGLGYIELPTVDALSNTFVRSMGILGRMEIANGGFGYVTGDILEFNNQYGHYGEGANGIVSSVDANGTIQQVSFTSREGYVIGGSGYLQSALPSINIISQNVSAYGANVVVSSIIGDGEILEATSNVIGGIEQLRVLSRGAGYAQNTTLNLSSQGDGTAQAIATVITGIYTYPGRYISDDGHLSAYNFLQDRDYYQPYSYVIKSDTSLNKYRKSLKELSHPAGMKLFGQHVYLNESAKTDMPANIINTYVFTDMSYVNLIAKFATSNSLSFIPTGNFEYLTYDTRRGTTNTAANLSNVIYDTQNVWYNAANTNQYANVRPNTYFTAAGLAVLGIYSNGGAIMAHANTLNTSNIMTVAAWVMTSNTLNYKPIIAKNDGSSRGFELGMNNGNPVVNVFPSTANNTLTIATGLANNTWQFIAFTYDGVNLRGYSNGVFTGVSDGIANGASDTTQPLMIGRLPGATPKPFHGKIASIEIYDKLLSNNEIQVLFNKDRQRFGA